ncbi:MAG: hypothetical protein Q9216_002287 [Gyalolechia sp. 2 TL-2023]
MRTSLLLCTALLAAAPFLNAQRLTSQNNTFASAARLTPQQQLDAGLDSILANNIEIALEFERSNLAHGSVDTDPFYTLPSNASAVPPGSLLKLQLSANTSAYTLPPNTALSRILYQSRTLNGSSVPGSAYILWPYSPRFEPDGFAVVGWAHGTSGAFANCAPSNIRNLWYQFVTPFTLALQGYVVVAPDYAGLGISQNLNGDPIKHPYVAHPAHANDLFFSVQAAQTAFATLSKRFILVGHSQGGGATWAAARRQASEPVEGYLGAIAASPVTNVRDLIALSGISAGAVGMLMANGLPDIFPAFNASSFLTPAGLARYALLSELQGCNSVVSVSFLEPELYQPAWYDTPYARRFFDLTSNGGQPIAGPMLVLQGEGDPEIPLPITSNAVNLTCRAHPESQIQYLTYPGVGHVPVMYASQATWLNWIADRFAGKPVSDGCRSSSIASSRPYSEYQTQFRSAVILKAALSIMMSFHPVNVKTTGLSLSFSDRTLLLTAIKSRQRKTSGGLPTFSLVLEIHLVIAMKPTILFVHGAWDNGSAWDPVCDLLAKHGYPTVTPSLPSSGGRPPIPSHLKDADVIRQELHRLVIDEQKDVIAVGHSYGGFVVTESVRGFEKMEHRKGGVIHCLVMSAFVGCRDESVMSVLDYKMPEFLELDPTDPAYVLIKGVETAFFNDVDPELASSRIAVAQPHSYATFCSTVQNPCWGGIPGDQSHQSPRLTYLICTNDQGIPEQLQRRMIAKTTDVGGAKWDVWRCDAGHNPAMSQPATISHALRKVAGEDIAPEPGVEIVEEAEGGL